VSPNGNATGVGSEVKCTQIDSFDHLQTRSDSADVMHPCAVYVRNMHTSTAGWRKGRGEVEVPPWLPFRECFTCSRPLECLTLGPAGRQQRRQSQTVPLSLARLDDEPHARPPSPQTAPPLPLPPRLLHHLPAIALPASPRATSWSAYPAKLLPLDADRRSLPFKPRPAQVAEAGAVQRYTHLTPTPTQRLRDGMPC